MRKNENSSPLDSSPDGGNHTLTPRSHYQKTKPKTYFLKKFIPKEKPQNELDSKNVKEVKNLPITNQEPSLRKSSFTDMEIEN